jgi:hypothetical protein
VKHDALVALLTEVLSKLEAKDAEGTDAMMNSLVDAFHATTAAAADPRVMPLFEACVAAADELSSALERELKSQARGARASTAYGAEP